MEADHQRSYKSAGALTRERREEWSRIFLEYRCLKSCAHYCEWEIAWRRARNSWSINGGMHLKHWHFHVLLQGLRIWQITYLDILASILMGKSYYQGLWTRRMEWQRFKRNCSRTESFSASKWPIMDSWYCIVWGPWWCSSDYKGNFRLVRGRWKVEETAIGGALRAQPLWRKKNLWKYASNDQYIRWEIDDELKLKKWLLISEEWVRMADEGIS